MSSGFNGTCDSYARELAVCGGNLELETVEACHLHRQSTDGAWIDDLDIICEETYDGMF